MTKKINLFANLKSDFASGLVVFLVALPLCLGIAMASGAPLFSGIIAGVVGGIIVGYLSQSHISVSGPAAGLTAIILTAITDLGAFDVFLMIRRPPRSTPKPSSAASDVYKRQRKSHQKNH